MIFSRYYLTFMTLWLAPLHASEPLDAWLSLLNNIQTLDTRSKLEAVNTFFNKIPYLSDRENWGVQDHWATPQEFLTRNAGDCEDFAIAKYVSLIKLGIPADELKLAHVKISISKSNQTLGAALDQKSNMQVQSHMVLLYLGPQTLVLDNTQPQILASTARNDIVPIYSFNNHSMQLHRQNWQIIPTSALSAPSQWRKLSLQLF